MHHGQKFKQNWQIGLFQEKSEQRGGGREGILF